MTFLLKAFLLPLIIPLWACHGLICHKGHKWVFNGAEICDLCDDGTFMPEDKHNKTECYPCSQVKDENEVVIRECSREEDAVIGCKAGCAFLNMTGNVSGNVDGVLLFMLPQ